MIDYDGKEAAMLQPLRARKDYGQEPQATIVKALPPVQDIPEDVEPVIEDYDKPPVLKPVQKTPYGPPEGRGRMMCPQCKRKLLFRLAALKDKANISCPYCSQVISSAAMYKEGSEYRAVIAKCLDPNFKAIWKMLPKSKELTLSEKQIQDIHEHLDTIYKKYRELETKPKTAG